MPATLVQTSSLGIGNSPSASASFSSLPTPGNVVLAIGVWNPSFGTAPTGVTITDNQSGNSYDTTYYGESGSGDENGCFLSWAEVVGSSGTFTASVAVTGGSADAGMAIILQEWSGLDVADLVDQIGTNVAFYGAASDFLVAAAGANAGADRLVIAILSGRSNSNFSTIENNPPLAGYTSIFNQLTGSFADARGLAAYKVVSALETSSADFGEVTGPPGRGTMLLVTLAVAAGGPTLVEASQAGSWSVRGNVGAPQAGAWSVRNTVDASQAGSWTLRGLADAAQQGAWSIRNLVQTDQAGSWSLRNLVTAAQAGSWSVQEAGMASASQAGSWSVRNLVSSVQAGSWSVRAHAEASQPGAWSVRYIVSASQSGAWTTRAFITASQGGAWRVYALVSATQAGSWSVEEAGRAVALQAGSWRVRNLVSASQAGAWSIQSEAAPLTDAEMRDLYNRVIALQAQIAQINGYTSLIPALL